jgi:hypothetical protein
LQKQSKKLFGKPLIKGHEEIVIASLNPALNNQQYCTHNRKAFKLIFHAKLFKLTICLTTFQSLSFMLALFEGSPERLIAIIMRISTGFLVDGFCGN